MLPYINSKAITKSSNVLTLKLRNWIMNIALFYDFAPSASVITPKEATKKSSRMQMRRLFSKSEFVCVCSFKVQQQKAKSALCMSE
jgi:hypothetical protein